MKLLLAAILLISVALSGCTTSKIYTFKKDRVDQGRQGNRGYIEGTPPARAPQKSVPQRTLIGFDVEIPVFAGEEAYLEKQTGQKREAEEVVVFEEEEYIVVEEARPVRRPAARTNFEPKRKAEPPVEEEIIIVDEEEEWIK